MVFRHSPWPLEEEWRRLFHEIDEIHIVNESNLKRGGWGVAEPAMGGVTARLLQTQHRWKFLVGQSDDGSRGSVVMRRVFGFAVL